MFFYKPKLIHYKMRKIYHTWLLLAALACVATTSCGSDDDENDDAQGDAVDMPIPSSIVDGVRLGEMTSSNGSTIMSVSYNDDGSIDKVSYNGTDYDFEYADTRAATSTGRKLLQITASYEENDYTMTMRANSFQFNTDGFLVSCKEVSSEESTGSYSESEEIKLNYTMAYNAKGRLSRIGISGSWTDVYEGEKESGSASTAIEYSYSGDNLTQVKIPGDDEDGPTTYTYDYGTTANSFNTMTQALSVGLAYGDDPILYMLARMGFLGNASAYLPTSMVYSSDDDTDAYSIIYNLWDTNNKIISEVWYSGEYVYGASGYTYGYVWTK